jgi:hypothetical protein
MGTVVLITIFAVLTFLMWANAYFTLLSRGVTE